MPDRRPAPLTRLPWGEYIVLAHVERIHIQGHSSVPRTLILDCGRGSPVQSPRDWELSVTEIFELADLIAAACRLETTPDLLAWDKGEGRVGYNEDPRPPDIFDVAPGNGEWFPAENAPEGVVVEACNADTVLVDYWKGKMRRPRGDEVTPHPGTHRLLVRLGQEWFRPEVGLSSVEVGLISAAPTHWRPFAPSFPGAPNSAPEPRGADVDDDANELASMLADTLGRKDIEDLDELLEAAGDGADALRALAWLSEQGPLVEITLFGDGTAQLVWSADHAVRRSAKGRLLPALLNLMAQVRGEEQS